MTRRPEDPDFASAAMMRLVAAGLTRQGIAAPGMSASGAHVPRSQKRDVLDTVLSTHGPKAILSIADAARHMSPEPVVQALARARDTSDLLERWHRLERFSHGRNTVESRQLGKGAFLLTHRARDGGLAPSFGESLLVLAVLTILAEMIGAADVMLKTETGDILRRDGTWRAPRQTRALGSVALSGLSKLTPDDRRSAAVPSENLVELLRKQLIADPLRRWTLADLAAAAGASQRTLQRRLTQRSISFSNLVSEARLQIAASQLCEADGPGLAEIGFLAGFSDQSHFARSFKRNVGTTPANYRSDFGR